MVWGILGALEREVALLRGEMTVSKVEEALGTQFIFGLLRGQEVVLARCGIGKVNAAACAAWLLFTARCDCVINVGIAGGVAHGLKPMDVVLSRELVFHDQDVEIPTLTLKGDEDLLQRCREACAYPGVLLGRLHEGKIATGDKFVTDNVTRDAIVAKVAPDCVEMEGAAIAHVATLAKKPFLVIRTMSDCADDAAEGTYDNFFAQAADQSAHIILKMLEVAV